MVWKIKILSKVHRLCWTCSVVWKRNRTHTEVVANYSVNDKLENLSQWNTFLVDNRDEDDYDEEEEDGSEGEYSDDEHGSDNEEEENLPVGLTPQQQELLQIVSKRKVIELVTKLEVLHQSCNSSGFPFILLFSNCRPEIEL